MTRHFAAFLMMGALVTSAAAAAKEPDWTGSIIARGAERDVIESTDILQRPYRPMHFYGNTIRRQYYRGRTLPSLQDMRRGTSAWMFRR